jgi:hypothetical protein
MPLSSGMQSQAQLTSSSCASLRLPWCEWSVDVGDGLRVRSGFLDEFGFGN